MPTNLKQFLNLMLEKDVNLRPDLSDLAQHKYLSKLQNTNLSVNITQSDDTKYSSLIDLFLCKCISEDQYDDIQAKNKQEPIKDNDYQTNLKNDIIDSH